MTILISLIFAVLSVQEPKPEQYICVENILTVPVVSKLPRRSRRGPLFYKWPQRELWAKRPKYWVLVPPDHYRWVPGKCGWKQ